MDLPSEYEGTLKDGFWPSIRIAPSFEDEFIDQNARKEYDEDEPFVGQAHDCPTESIRVNRDLYEGHFVAIRPSDDNTEHPIWIARALSNPNSNPEYPSYVLIQYFRPILHNKNVQKFYTSWDCENGLRGKINQTNEEVWESTNSILTAWKLGTRKDTSHCVMSIPPQQIQIIHQSLVAVNE